VKQILSDPTKVINNRTFFENNFFEILCKETNLYYFQNQGKYASSSKELNGGSQCGRIGKRNCNVNRAQVRVAGLKSPALG
jgi:hypothetical protein